MVVMLVTCFWAVGGLGEEDDGPDAAKEGSQLRLRVGFTCSKRYRSRSGLPISAVYGNRGFRSGSYCITMLIESGLITTLTILLVINRAGSDGITKLSSLIPDFPLPSDAQKQQDKKTSGVR